MTGTGPRIQLRGVREAGLEGIDLEIPLGRLVVFAADGGRGAETLARRVLVGESRRRYLLALSPFERERLGGVGAAADVDDIEGLPPARRLPGPIGRAARVIDRLHLGGDLTRVVQARAEILCHRCGGPCRALHADAVADLLSARFADEPCLVIAPLRLEDPGNAAAVLEEIGRAGFRRVRAGGAVHRLDAWERPAAELVADGVLQVVVDRLSPTAAGRAPGRVGEAVRNARSVAAGRALLVGADSATELWADARRACLHCGAAAAEPDWQQLVAAGTVDTAGEGSAERTGAVLLGERPLAAVLAELRLTALGELAADGPETEAPEGAPTGADGSAYRLGQVAEVADRLGLGTLPLWRREADLAHGERLLLAVVAACTTGLSGVLHVVDSPPSALDPETRTRAVAGLRGLLEAGGSVVVVDGDPDAGSWADDVIDLGTTQGPGDSGDSSAAAVTDDPGSEAEQLVLEAGSGQPRRVLPIDRLVALTGPTGAGKSALLREVAAALGGGGSAGGRAGRIVARAPALRRIVEVSTDADGGPPEDGLLFQALGLGRPLARVFAEGPAATEKGLPAEAFRLDRPGGRCTACEGRGRIRHRLDLVEEVAVTCGRCGGRRFRDEILQVTAHGVTIAEALAFRLDEAAAHFARQRALKPALATAAEAGLGARRLDTAVSDLERSEAVRLQLVRQAVQGRRGDLVLVDRPLAGCTPTDRVRVLGALRRVVGTGAGVLATDATGELAAAADHVIELTGAPPPPS